MTDQGSGFNPRTGTYMISIVNLVASFCAIITVRTFGRRPLLKYGHFSIGVAHVLVGTFTILGFDIGTLVSICLFIFVYQNSSGPIAWLYASETCVDVALGVVIQTLWFTVLVLSLITEPLMNSALQPAGVFYLFGFFSFIATCFVHSYIRETKGLSDKEKKSLYSKQLNVEDERTTTTMVDTEKLVDPNVVDNKL